MLNAVVTAAKGSALRALGGRAWIDLKLRAITRGRALTILNLHRVAPDDASSYPPLQPDLFEYLLVFLKQHFHFVTFASMREPSPSGLSKLILSFDDGYADFAEFAAPLLARHGVRVNHNIIPACVESGLPPLNVLMQDFIGRASIHALRNLDVPGFGFDPGRMRRSEIGRRLSMFLKNRPIAEQSELAKILLPQVAKEADFKPTRMMSLDQIREMALTHEVGAHSFEHASLGEETDQYARNDVDRCKQWFAEKLSRPMAIYAVPNGSYRRSQIEILRHAGMQHILLVDEDFSSPDCDVHKRFTFGAHSPHQARFKATGGLRWPRKDASCP